MCSSDLNGVVVEELIPNGLTLINNSWDTSQWNFRQVEETHIMENILYNDLVRRGYNVDVGVVGYSRRQADAKGAVKKIRVQLEVDFVVNQGSRRYYIQSALHVDDPQKRKQKIQSLNRIRDSFFI